MITSLEQANKIIKQQQAQIEELTRQLASALRQLKTLQHQVEQLLRTLYGRRSEKMDPKQLMFDEILLQATPRPEPETREEKRAAPTKVRAHSRRHPGRIPIPEHLERVEIVVDLKDEDKVCPKTGKPLKQIGWEVSEKLEYRPGKLVVNVYKRPKYVSPESKAADQVGVITAPLPDHPIERCKADVGLLSHVIVSKFSDHLPFYRQDGIFAREGVEIPRATQASWLMQIYEAIEPLGEVLKEVVLEAGVLFTDDSIFPLQSKGSGRVVKARLWTYVRGGPGPPLTVYDFSRDRSKERPLKFLDGYQGYVHADAYSGYDELFRAPGIIEVGCWVHTRRKFHEAVSSRPKEATEILAYIAELYRVEDEAKELTPDSRARLRQQKARPVIDTIFRRLEELKHRMLPSEPFGKACTYALNQRQALYRYLEDGWLRPDNNIAENAIRPLALGRKNWLFTGSERGGRAAALYLGLIQSCKGCEVNPWEYFDDVLRRIMSHPVSRLRELLPDKWRPLPKDDRGLIIGEKEQSSSSTSHLTSNLSCQRTPAPQDSTEA